MKSFKIFCEEFSANKLNLVNFLHRTKFVTPEIIKGVKHNIIRILTVEITDYDSLKKNKDMFKEISYFALFVLKQRWKEYEEAMINIIHILEKAGNYYVKKDQLKSIIREFNVYMKENKVGNIEYDLFFINSELIKLFDRDEIKKKQKEFVIKYPLHISKIKDLDVSLKDEFKNLLTHSDIGII